MAKSLACQGALPDSIPWTKDCNFTQKIRPQELRDGGYIDLPGHFTDDLDISITSLFGRKKFENITNEDYTLLNPVLRLATKFLQQPQLMPFWYALFNPSCCRKIRNSSVHQFYDRYMYRIDLFQKGITVSQSRIALRLLQQMEACISIRFAPINTYGTTEPCTSRPGLPNFPSTHGSTILLDQSYLDILREYQILKTIPNFTQSTLDDPTHPSPTTASILRTRFHLAKTILHELCHAVKWATLAPQPTGLFSDSLIPSPTILRLPSQPKPGRRPHRLVPPLEPFFAHQRVAELGCAWEQLTFHGLIHPLCSLPSARWGLTLEKWPNTWSTHGKPERGTRARRAWSTKYAVSMAWVASLWREDFWRGVERFGAHELWPERVLGVREWREGAEWGEDDSEGWSSGDYENGIEGAEREKRDRRAVARANRLRVGEDEEDEEVSEEGDSSEGRVCDKEGVVRDGGWVGEGEGEEMEVEEW
ncbi:hypothetical protein AOQ84DRAFT_392685 [Glonium stellatum]|uniref:Uncharacterized protein n=1 Tax=Glonium stellatum TaxID=574774 RepID=A0A8E2EQ42_9PEZI|nr:hypothetical protein AOQ84DRAFT_392685 [Glonium stellatum]